MRTAADNPTAGRNLLGRISVELDMDDNPAVLVIRPGSSSLAERWAAARLRIALQLIYGRPAERRRVRRGLAQAATPQGPLPRKVSPMFDVCSSAAELIAMPRADM